MQKNIMKNFFVLLLVTSTVTAAAQQKPSIDSFQIHASPVLRSYVAPDVVERAKKKYGFALYCIERTAAHNCENAYLVGLIRNGRLSMEWMCDDPKIAFLIIKRTFVDTNAFTQAVVTPNGS